MHMYFSSVTGLQIPTPTPTWSFSLIIKRGKHNNPHPHSFNSRAIMLWFLIRRTCKQGCVQEEREAGWQEITFAGWRFCCVTIYHYQLVYQEDKSQSIVLCSLAKCTKPGASPTAYMQAVFTTCPCMRNQSASPLPWGSLTICHLQQSTTIYPLSLSAESACQPTTLRQPYNLSSATERQLCLSHIDVLHKNHFLFPIWPQVIFSYIPLWVHKHNQVWVSSGERTKHYWVQGRTCQR